MLSMKYELMGGLGLLGALFVILVQPGSEKERKALSATIETARETVSYDVFGPQ